MILHALASQPHYVAHLAPIWMELAPEERGVFYAMGAAHPEAVRLGLDHRYGLARRTRSMPPHTATRVGHVQPHWLVAGFSDLRRLGPHRRAVFVEHGAGQTYQGVQAGFAPYYSGGPQRGRVDVFLCPNATVAKANAQAYPDAQCLVVGSPHLERLAAYRAQAYHAPRTEIVVTFHFEAAVEVAPEARSAWPHYRGAIPTLERQTGFTLLGHGHPRAWRQLAQFWGGAGVEPCQHQDEAMSRARLLVADNTSALFEAAALGIPVVVLNAPWYRRDVEHGLRFWEYADVGLQVNHPDDLLAAISQTLRLDPQHDRRHQIGAAVFDQPEEGAAVAAVAGLRSVLA